MKIMPRQTHLGRIFNLSSFLGGLSKTPYFLPFTHPGARKPSWCSFIRCSRLPRLPEISPGMLCGCKRGRDLSLLGRFPCRVYTRSALKYVFSVNAAGGRAISQPHIRERTFLSGPWALPRNSAFSEREPRGKARSRQG